MDGRGGGCMVRYSAARGGGFSEITYGMSKVERMMLKFRPIAPKPIAAGSGSSGSTADHNDGYGRNRRRKRKYVRVNGNKKKKDTITTTGSKKRKVSTSNCDSSGGGDAVVTLPLMPETPDRKEKLLSPILLNFNNYYQQITPCNDVLDHAVVIPSPSPEKSEVTSCVTVESVTETWINGGGGGGGGDGLGITDQARVMNMEMDTCPSFITNSRDTVVWTNKAYRELTAAGGGSDNTTVVTVKKFNRVTMPVTHPVFTCKVKVTWGRDRGSSPFTVTAPCDVWRLRCGGNAWRLDVNAALSLGRCS